MLRLSLSALCIAASQSVALADGAARDATVDELKAEIAAVRQHLTSDRAQVSLLRAELGSALGERDRSLAQEQESDSRRLEGVDDLAGAVSHAWLILCGALVMFMHAGFAMLEAGSCRSKNTSNVLLKNLLNLCVGTMAWYICGWAFAYGGPLVEEGDDAGYAENQFIGTTQFLATGFLEVDSNGNQTPGGGLAIGWFFQWAFCTAAATIVSGGVAERVQSPTYACYAFFMAAYIYPVVVAWTWGYGWISRLMDDTGFIDFAGSGIVHLTGGVSALAGTIVLGPRKGRFDPPTAGEFDPHSMPLVVLGTLSLWFGWYGFNCGSTLGMDSSATGELAAHVAMNTTLSAACGGIVTFVLKYVVTHQYDVGALCNGILGGLVSITAPCGNVESGSAVAIGCLGGAVYLGASMLLQKLHIDDPVDASPVHGACGIWGVLAAAIFDMGNGFDHFHGWSGFSCMTDEKGNCQEGVWGKAFLVQIIMVLMVCLWAGTLSGVTFFALKMTGLLRIDENTESQGLDAVKHSPPKAYSGILPAAPSHVPPSKSDNSAGARRELRTCSSWSRARCAATSPCRRTGRPSSRRERPRRSRRHRCPTRCSETTMAVNRRC